MFHCVKHSCLPERRAVTTQKQSNNTRDQHLTRSADYSLTLWWPLAVLLCGFLGQQTRRDWKGCSGGLAQSWEDPGLSSGHGRQEDGN